MIYVAVILLCSVLATEANIPGEDDAAVPPPPHPSSSLSPSDMGDVQDIPVDVAEYEDDGDEDDLLVDQLEDIKMADDDKMADLLRDIERRKVRDMKDPFITAMILGGVGGISKLIPRMKRWGPKINGWGSRLGWGRRRRKGKW